MSKNGLTARAALASSGSGTATRSAVIQIHDDGSQLELSGKLSLAETPLHFALHLHYVFAGAERVFAKIGTGTIRITSLHSAQGYPIGSARGFLLTS
ncbi:hypothetical protein AB833_10115 [Chromatiales bacterium (ex Bugula neritina AB1)]|nr:hypothetical protein AB833_10115 [Chromatiales bacterium (ex Bugula neritina AB1)]